MHVLCIRKTGKILKYQLLTSLGYARSNRQNDWTLPALQWPSSLLQCNQSPHNWVFMCMCVFNYHLTSSWYPRNKRIISVIASKGSGWRFLVGGRVTTVQGGSGQQMEDILNSLQLTQPCLSLHLLRLQVKAPGCMHDPAPLSPSFLHF